MKLQLNHIQHYPIGENGLKMIYGGYGSPEQIVTILGISNYNDIPELKFIMEDGTIDTDVIDWFKPLYLPLSNLTKPIKVEGYNDGKEFVPMEELKRIEPEYPLLIEDNSVFFTDACNLNMLEISRINKLFQLLYQWHFAVDIPDGTWININTL